MSALMWTLENTVDQYQQMIPNKSQVSLSSTENETFSAGIWEMKFDWVAVYMRVFYLQMVLK